MRKVLTRGLFVLSWVVLQGCNGNPVTSVPAPPAPPVLGDPTKPTDEYLIWFAYNGPQFPDGFYFEQMDEGSPYYVNTVSVTPQGAREAVWIELCTDDLEQAKEWSELSSRYSAYYRDLVSQRETEKYFEFKRVYADRTTDILLSRAHKCSYFDASNHDRFLDPPSLGNLNKRPLDAAAAQEVIEYLWFAGREGLSHKVLHSAVTEETGYYQHIIYAVSLGIGDWGMYDVIQLYRFTYAIEQSTGEVLRTSRQMLRSVRGTYHPNALPG